MLDTAQLPKNGHTKTIQLSSNATLFWRVFVPIFITVFISGLVLAFILIDEENLYLPIPALPVRIIAVIIWFVWLAILKRTLWRLKRVDADDNFMYVSNYWQTVRYPWQDLADVEEKKRLNRQIVNFNLKQPGRFGQKISFLPGSAYADWKKQFDQL